MLVADLELVHGIQSNPHWSPNYFIFIGNSEKMLAKWLNRAPSAKLNPLFKFPGSAPDLYSYYGAIQTITLKTEGEVAETQIVL